MADATSSRRTDNDSSGKEGGSNAAIIRKGTPEIIPGSWSPDTIRRLLQEHPLVEQHNYSYGTAGFRDHHEVLAGIMVRVGLAVSLKAQQGNGHDLGIMITASHNAEIDNGVKVSSAAGGMLSAQDEAWMVDMILHSNDSIWNQSVWTASSSENKDPRQQAPRVHVGWDTRWHSVELFAPLVLEACAATGTTVMSHGVVTTPYLHHVVWHANPQLIPWPIPIGRSYVSQLVDSYAALVTLHRLHEQQQQPSLLVDCACGVGYPWLKYIKEQSPNLLSHIQPHNGPGQGPLNERCGSEWVQKQVKPPVWYPVDSNDTKTIPYAASLDGDADRVVFFAQINQDKIALLDGDAIAVLMCFCLREWMQQAGMFEANVTLGVVQTAYANGASTRFLKNLLGEDSVVIAKTGVKHVHTAAHDSFDVGVYFEANGHGTVLFGERFYQVLYDLLQKSQKETSTSVASQQANRALQTLRLLPSLISQTVGDALSDLLVVDFMLQYKQWTLQDNWRCFYQDYPSRQVKVRVKDRSIIKTNDNETQCLLPVSLQEQLNEIMSRVRHEEEQKVDTTKATAIEVRCFVRPSGTEDVVRIYAEASTTQETVDRFTQQVIHAVYAICQGVGECPVVCSSVAQSKI